MHVGLSGFLKHVGFLIKLVSPFKLQNCSKHFLLIEELKSSKNKKLWYSLLYSSMMQLRHSRWFDRKLFLGLHEPLMNHFLFLKFTSTQIDLMLQSDSTFRNLEGISPRTCHAIRYLFVNNSLKNLWYVQ